MFLLIRNTRILAARSSAVSVLCLVSHFYGKGPRIGVLVVQRKTVRPFTEKQIDLVTTFADQAVIAIENVRLFDEVQARTRDLGEALEQADRDLRSLARDVEFARRVVSLCSRPYSKTPRESARPSLACCGYPKATCSVPLRCMPRLRHLPKRGVASPSGGRTRGRLLAAWWRRNGPLKLPIFGADPAFINDPKQLALLELAGARTISLCQCSRSDELIGSVAIYRQEVRAFHRQADRAGQELRGSSGHRHREHAPAQRTALSAPTISASRSNSRRRHRRRARGHLQLAGRTWSPCSRPSWRTPYAALRRQVREPSGVVSKAKASAPVRYLQRAASLRRGAPATRFGDPPSVPDSALARAAAHAKHAAHRLPTSRAVACLRRRGSAIGHGRARSAQGGCRAVLSVPMLKDGAADRRHWHLPPGRAARSATSRSRWSQNFAQPGGHRDREHPPAQRAARIPAAADRYRRRAQGHQPLDL